MTQKLSTAFYSACVAHPEMPGLFYASFAIPGQLPMWVTGPDGKPKNFRDAQEAELAGFRVLAAKLNRARDPQTFRTKKDHRSGEIKSFRTKEPERKHSVETVFGKRQP